MVAEDPSRSLDISVHALERMAERGITRQEVEAAVFAPSSVCPGSAPATMRHERTVATRRRIVVIVEAGSNPIRVVSTWVLGK